MQCELINEICYDCNNKTCVPEPIEFRQSMIKDLSKSISIILDIANNPHTQNIIVGKGTHKSSNDNKALLEQAIINLQHVRANIS